jgi:DNA-binding transcriptional MerR regulator
LVPERGCDRLRRKNTSLKFNVRRLGGSFSTAQTARLTGLSPRQLDYWDRQGFVQPSLVRASGYGSARRYSFEDLVRLRVAAKLRAAGFGLNKIRQCVRTLRRLDPSREGMADVRLLVVGSRVVWARSARELVDVLQEGQLMLVFPLGEEVRGVTAALETMAREPRPDLFDLEAPTPRERGRRRP